MKGLSSWTVGICALLGGQSALAAITIDLSSTGTDSIKSAAATVARGMMSYYTGNRTGDVPGNLPQPYYWWEAGAMFGALVDYWYYTGDTTYNEVTTQALQNQVGPNSDYMPPNQTKTEGNDDQAFWGMAVLSAAEVKFPDPPEDEPQWLALAQAVFNTQVGRWDQATCNGGLKWQIFTFNNGYNYKNTISNGCFFNMAARLAMYTKNDTYAQWADKMWDWVGAVGLMSPQYQFFDGTDDTQNCTSVNHIQWSYNAGVFLYGAANMFNYTNGSDKWKSRIDGILQGSEVFFQNDVMYEVACEKNGKCNIDQRSFKAYLARWMAATTKLAPYTYDKIMPKIQASARAAAAQCNAGQDGNQCGLQWTNNGQNDGSFGVGEQMSALEVIQSNLITKVAGPVSNNTGGTSKGDPTAGSRGDDQAMLGQADPITTGDKVGAGFLTTLVLIGILGGAWWMVA